MFSLAHSIFSISITFHMICAISDVLALSYNTHSHFFLKKSLSQIIKTFTSQNYKHSCILPFFRSSLFQLSINLLLSLLVFYSSLSAMNSYPKLSQLLDAPITNNSTTTLSTAVIRAAPLRPPHLSAPKSSCRHADKLRKPNA